MQKSPKLATDSLTTLPKLPLAQPERKLTSAREADAIDAEAICEAVTRPTMRFVAVKTVEQQSLLSLHRARDLLVHQSTQFINNLRGLVAELGIYIPRGFARGGGFAEDITLGQMLDLPDIANEVIHNLSEQLMALSQPQRSCASIGDGSQFKNGREFDARLGLTPANKSRGGKEKLGRATKMGDQYHRQFLVVGMTSLVRQTRSHPERASKRLTSLLERKRARVATVAMANKTARIVWAILARNAPYSPRASA